MGAVTMAVIGLGISAAATGYSAVESRRQRKKAEKEQEKAIKREKKVLEEQERQAEKIRMSEVEKRKRIFAAGQQRIGKRRDVLTGPGGDQQRKTMLGM